MLEGFDREKIGEYKKKCEDKIREEGTFKQINFMKAYLDKIFDTLFDAVIILGLNWLGNYLERNWEKIYDSIYLFFSLAILYFLFFALKNIFFTPFYIIYQNKKHLKMSKEELEKEVEEKIKNQQIKYDRIIKLYDGVVEEKYGNKDKKIKENLGIIEESINKIVNGECLSNYEVKRDCICLKINSICKIF